MEEDKPTFYRVEGRKYPASHDHEGKRTEQNSAELEASSSISSTEYVERSPDILKTTSARKKKVSYKNMHKKFVIVEA